MDSDLIHSIVARHHLQIMGGFCPHSDDPLPADTRFVLMLGPLAPSFWRFVTTSKEFLDGKKDPLDRWSQRVIGQIATETASTPLFPFGGPPYLPFQDWAIRSGRCWVSPVGLLVHDTAGLLVSFRGALAMTQSFDLPPGASQSPCENCRDRPCENHCPIHALDDKHYDHRACLSYLTNPLGIDCLSKGCAVRRACPINGSTMQPPSQARFHQEARLSASTR